MKVSKRKTRPDKFPLELELFVVSHQFLSSKSRPPLLAISKLGMSQVRILLTAS
jgi:hypothetical protein